MTTLKIKLSPHSHANKIWGWEGDRLKVSVTAAPEDGKANEALLDLLAEKLHLPVSTIKIQYGEADRLKTLQIWNLEPEHLEERFERFAPQAARPKKEKPQNPDEKRPS